MILLNVTDKLVHTVVFLRWKLSSLKRSVLWPMFLKRSLLWCLCLYCVTFFLFSLIFIFPVYW